jgi:hypothetical protein
MQWRTTPKRVLLKGVGPAPPFDPGRDLPPSTICVIIHYCPKPIPSRISPILSFLRNSKLIPDFPALSIFKILNRSCQMKAAVYCPPQFKNTEIELIENQPFSKTSGSTCKNGRPLLIFPLVHHNIPFRRIPGCNEWPYLSRRSVLWYGEASFPSNSGVPG